jgi:hypothetical protein
MFGVCDSFLLGSHKATRKLGHEERNMGKKTFWAHKDHTLAKHLNDTGQKAARFARAFQAEDHGRIAGMLHDLSKAE